MTVFQKRPGWFASHWRNLFSRPGPSIAESKNIEYDRQTIEVMRRCLEPDSVCIDVGAHKGDVLREMCRLAPRARHHAFEPIPALAQQLRLGFPGSNIHQLALSDRSGTASFKHVRNAEGYSGLKERAYDHENPDIEDIEVEVARLDDVIPSDESIGFIKLDIEGGEYNAIKGAIGLIHRCRPVIVFEAGEPSSSYYGVSPDSIFSLIEDLPGYRLFTMKMWLEGAPPFDRDAFIRNYPMDFYYLACPA